MRKDLGPLISLVGLFLGVLTHREDSAQVDLNPDEIEDRQNDQDPEENE